MLNSSACVFCWPCWPLLRPLFVDAVNSEVSHTAELVAVGEIGSDELIRSVLILFSNYNCF